MSATPSSRELETSRVVEQIVRPTGLGRSGGRREADTKGQIDDLVAEIRVREEREQRVLVTTLTKKMAEDLTDYLVELGRAVRTTCTARSTPSSESRSSARSAWASSTCSSGSTCSARARSPGGVARRHPRRRQGRVPPVGDVVDPDDRASRAQRRGSGDHVRRLRHRLDAQGALGDEPAPACAARVQRRARDRPADGPQERHRHPRDGAGAGRRRRTATRARPRATDARSRARRSST